MSEKYVVIVSLATDYNRGDQALLWEAENIIRDALNINKIYIMKNEHENLEQSCIHGLEPIVPILHHPSYKFKSDKHINNINYSWSLKFKWGMVAVVDFLNSYALLHKITRRYGEKKLEEEQKRTYSLLRNADAVFVKGGGFLHTYGKITDIYYIYYSLFNILLSIKFKRKIFVLPNSFGPFKGLGIKNMVRRTLRKCDFLAVRESISQKMLKEINVKNYILAPDMAFYLRKSKSSLAQLIVEEFEIKKGNKNVAITVRPYRFPEMKNPVEVYSRYKKAIILFCDWLIDNDYRPIFIEHTYSENEHENDRKCIDEIIEKTSQKVSVLSNKNLNCEELKYIYSNFDYIVGTRFHSIIFSLAEGVPGIAISYSGNKATGIMKDIGIEKFVLSANSITKDKLVELFVELVRNKKIYMEKVKNYKNQAINSYYQLVDKIKEFND